MNTSLRDMTGGAVVVTRFDCPNRRRVVGILWRHWVLRSRCRRQLDRLIDVKIFVSWRNKTVRSVSLWSDAEGLFSMGSVDAHVRATRMPAQRGITTSCGIFSFAGEWRQLMFGAPTRAISPLVTDLSKPLSDTTD